MLYIASALTPTPILGTLSIPEFTSHSCSSLIVAKPDRVEVWDVDKTGLVWRTELEVWGSVLGIERVVSKDIRPHLLVLLGPPNTHLLLLAYQNTPKPSLVVTSSIPLSPPTPSLRRAEFFTSVIAQDNVVLVSLWVGILSCIEIEVEKDKDAKKRRSSFAAAGGPNVEEEGKRLKFRDNFNINIREHNLLHLSFMPSTQDEPTVNFLWLSSTSALQLQSRRISLTAHSFIDASRPIDVITPLRSLDLTADTDFNDVPYSCPAARRVLPVSNDSALVIGDEHTVLYSLAMTLLSPKASRASLSSAGAATSPRASAVRRSPQAEMTGTGGKRRKSSMTGKGVNMENSEQWEWKPIWRTRQGFGTILAATVLESHSTGASVLIGDECGRLTALGWEFDRAQGALTGGRSGSVEIYKANLGIASPPSSMAYLDSAHVFLSSACGDSLLLELDISPIGTSSPISPSKRGIPVRKGKGRARDNEEGAELTISVQEDDEGSFAIKERWMNLAPVKDFCVIEEESGVLSHLAVASGASTSNSLRVIRSGVGFEEVINVEGITGVVGMWPFANGKGTSALLLSTSTSTMILQLEPDVLLADIHDKLASQRTLAASHLSYGQMMVQVTPRDVSVWSDVTTGTLVANWEVGVESEIVAGQICGQMVLIAKRGGEVVLLSATDTGLGTVLSTNVNAEISSLSILAHPNTSSPVIAVGTWTNDIVLYTLYHLKTALKTVMPIKEAFFASSLLLKPSDSSTAPTSGVQLVAGLSNGSMIIYDLETSNQGGGVEIKGRKASSLGTRPLMLCSTQQKAQGGEMIVALGLNERISVVFEHRDRIDFSSVSKKDVTAAAAISSTALGNALVLASPAGLAFVKVNSLKNLSVQTLDLGERSASRVISVKDQPVIGVGSISRKLDAETGDVLQSGYFELRDSTSLELLAEMSLMEREEVTCLNRVSMYGRNYLAVGTAVFPSDGEMDEFTHGGSSVTAKEGHLLLIDPRQSADGWEIAVIVKVDTVGPVYDVKVIHGFLAAAAGSRVSIQRLDSSPPTLTEVGHFSSAFVAQHLYVTSPSKLYAKERLVVGDGMRSVFVLEVDEGSGMILSDQRDMATHQVTALERVQDGGEGVFIADGYSNLLTYRLKESIESAASFGLHEEISRFRQGSLVPPSSAPEVIVPDLLFATVDGRLGIIGELSESATRTMDDLQRNMDKYYKGPGGISWKTWRRGGTEMVKRDTAGFIDGDFVQKFLDADLLPSSEANKILHGTNPHEGVSRLATDGSREPAERSDVARVLEAACGLH